MSRPNGPTFPTRSSTARACVDAGAVPPSPAPGGAAFSGSIRRWIAAAQRGDEGAKQRLVERNLRLVHSIVRRFSYRLHPGAGATVEADDLFQVGCLGLLKAVERFDLNQPVRFSTYAVPVIVGEIRRYLREQQAVRVPRTLRDQGLQVAACRDRLSQEWGRSPSVEEVSQALGMSREEVAAAEAAIQLPESLDRMADAESDAPRSDVGVDEPGYASLVDNLALRQALESMEPWERDLVVLRYFEHRPQTEVARLMGVSQAHVSRAERRVLARLRRYLGG